MNLESFLKNRLREGYVNVYEFLDEYAKWLDERGLKPICKSKKEGVVD